MVINEPEGFTVRKQVTRKGKKVMRWVDMRKGVAYLFRYRDVSFAANSRYLAALAEVDDPTDAIRTLDRITTRKQVAPKRTAKAFNPLARDETQSHAHGLIAKIPHSRRWRLTKQGRIAMTASIQLREIQFPITDMKLTAWHQSSLLKTENIRRKNLHLGFVPSTMNLDTADCPSIIHDQ